MRMSYATRLTEILDIKLEYLKHLLQLEFLHHKIPTESLIFIELQVHLRTAITSAQGVNVLSGTGKHRARAEAALPHLLAKLAGRL